MKDWIPFFQSLVWPVFVLMILLWFRRRIAEILGAIKKRIAEGAPVEAGPAGFKLGPAPKLPDHPDPDEMIDDGDDVDPEPALVARQEELKKIVLEDPAEKLHLVHTSQFWKVKFGRNYYRILISLDPSGKEALTQVDKVVYYLHSTFKNPVREVKDPTGGFMLLTAAWGEFTLRAEVYLKNRPEPVRLSRYLDIKSAGA